MATIPFHDEQSFKAWCHPPGVASTRMQPPGPDGSPSTEQERHYAKLLVALVRPENQAVLDATPGLVSRFVRGYVLRSFATHADPVTDAAVLLNMSCQWRSSLQLGGDDAILGATAFMDAELDGRAEWDTLCPQSFAGRDEEGRVVYYAKWTAAVAIEKLSTATVQPLHFQDMLRLEAEKQVASAAAIAAGKKGGETHHHVVVVDMANGDGGAGISRAMLKYLKAMGQLPLGPSATQHFFPDVLERAIIINAPLLFRALWTVAKRFLEAETAAKYTICGSDFAPTLAAAGVPKEALPRCCVGYGRGPNPAGLVAKPTVTKLKRAGAVAEQTVLVTRKREGLVAVKWRVALPKGSKGGAVHVAMVHPGGVKDLGVLKIGSTNVNSKSSPMQQRPVFLSGTLSVQPQKKTLAEGHAAAGVANVEVELDDMAALPPAETVTLTIKATSLTNANVTVHILVDPNDSGPAVSARATLPLQHSTTTMLPVVPMTAAAAAAAADDAVANKLHARPSSVETVGG